MRTDGTNIGETVRTLRKARNLSRAEMAEMIEIIEIIEISVSHLEKIESGARRPGMDTYQKILAVVKAETVMHNEMETVQERCAGQMQQILMDSTEKQALFLFDILEYMAQKIAEIL